MPVCKASGRKSFTRRMDAFVRPLPARKDSDEGVQVTFFCKLLRHSAAHTIAVLGHKKTAP